MSQLNSLLESANQYKSLQSDAARLATKWSKTGLLEGLNSEADKSNMSMILENQAKQLVQETSLSGGGTSSVGSFTAGVGEQWAGVALPLVRKVFGQIAAKEFVSVQPMNLPSGLVFYLDFQYGTTKGTGGNANFTAGNSMYGDTDGNTPFGNGATGGAYGAGRFGYSINATSSITTVDSTGSAGWSDLNFDADFSASATNDEYATVKIALADFDNIDQEAIRSFELYSGSAGTPINEPAFTKIVGTDLQFIAKVTDISVGLFTATVSYSLAPTDKNRGDFEDKNTALNSLNNPISIPEINVQMQSSAIVAKTRKLKAVWTPEFAQDLNAYHALDAEAELTSVMSEYISLEIDLEILDMLIESAAGGTEVWSAVNNRSIVDNGTGNDGTVTDLGFYNTQGQWFQTLGTKLQKVSNRIHQRTLRGGANFLVCSPTVATILESIPGFAANSDGDAAKMSYAFGVQKAGQLNSRYTVYKNPYMTENTILLGFRGSQFLEAGAVFAPYIPLIMTPLVYDPETFTPRKGLLTRYAKKVVRPEFYGKILCDGLTTL
ncbi:MAG: hypothetical protein CL662_07785 [Bacteroidetes bacterium]|nr:hypothetical protein [Bacteroidota bacterium]